MDRKSLVSRIPLLILLLVAISAGAASAPPITQPPDSGVTVPEPLPPAATPQAAPSLEPLELTPALTSGFPRCPIEGPCPGCLPCTTDLHCQQLCASGVGQCVESTGCCMCMLL